MAKYLIAASYTSEGVKGLLKSGGTARVAAVRKTVEALGGKIESFYFAFGDVDAYVTADLPDNITAAALGLAVSGAGFTTVQTIVLLTAEEIDAAAKKQVDYTPPGK